MIDAKITIIESTDQITQKILKALLPEVKTYFRKVFDRTSEQIATLVQDSIIASPEYQSLLSGKLKYEFGLPDSDSRLNTILEIISQITTKYNAPKIVKNHIEASFTLSMIQSDYKKLLESSAAILNTEKGSQLEWLKWLLLFGDKTIIKDYFVQIGSNNRSRTGNAVMRSSTRSRWGVPPEFAGTQNNNWITRAIDGAQNNIEQLLTNALKDI